MTPPERRPFSLLRLLMDAGQAWIAHRHASTGAALSYYAAFSLAPMLVIAVSLSGLVYGRESVEGHVLAQFQDLLGHSGADLLQKMIRASYLSSSSWTATAVGAVGMLVGATALFGELAAAFERIFGPPRHPRRAWEHLLLDRLKGLALIVGIGFLLLVSLVTSAGLMALGEWVAQWSQAQALLLTVLQSALSLLILSALFAMMLRVMAPCPLKPFTVAVGSVTTALLFELGKWGLGMYLGRGVVGSVFGAAGSLAVLLVWLNYVSLVILYGVEITAQLLAREGAAEVPR